MAFDPTLWKINGATIGALGIVSPRLVYVNGAADSLSWDDPGARFDADLRWIYDAAIVLTRGETVVFRGKIRRTPRFLGAEAESITYEAHGPWAWLEEVAYLQDHRYADNPDALAPALEAKAIGRVVLGMALTEGGAAKVNIDAALAEIIESAAAGVAVGDINGLDWPIPLDEAVDLQTTDAAGRVLQWAPDAVQWFTYAPSPPAYRAGRRAVLTVVEVPVPAPGAGGLTSAGYVPLESISIEPAHKLQASAVVLFFRRSSEATYTLWERHEKQAVPEAATGREPRAIVRTLDLAGATSGGVRVSQPVRVEALSALLASEGTILPGLGEAGNAFNALSAFWRRKVPRLAGGGVTLLGFRACTRKRVPGPEDVDPNQSSDVTTACNGELVQGAITDWMLDQYSTLKVEEQELACEVSLDETIDGTTTRKVERYTTRITATSAATRVYRERGGLVEVGEPAEAAMPGLAQKIHDGVSVLHYEGSFSLVEEEASLSIRPGVVVNLTGSRAEWATMRALVQSAEVDIEAGRTKVTVGPPHHLGAQELQELFRSNRTRRDVTSAYARSTGQGSQGLPVFVEP